MRGFAEMRLRAVAAFDSPLGPLIAAANEAALCALEFCDDADPKARLDRLLSQHAAARLDPSHPVLMNAQRELAEYFDGRRTTFTIPVTYAGTPFQHRVWTLLTQIRYGEAISYLELARRCGDLGATRAVGAANGKNPIAIVVPCHRVINANGDLGGYGGGLWRKRRLLELERGQGVLDL